MNEFIRTETTGELFYDKILFETYIPILFTCKNEKNEIFMCVCCLDNASGRKWLVTKVSASIVVSMLQDEITIRDVFLSNQSVRISVKLVNKELSIENNNSDWEEDSEYLPKKDAYIDAEPGEYDDEITYYENWLNIVYGEENYTSLVKAMEVLSDRITTLMDDIDINMINVSAKVISSEVMNAFPEVKINLEKKDWNSISIDYDKMSSEILEMEDSNIMKGLNVTVELSEEDDSLLFAA